MKVLLKKHWANHEPTIIVESKKEALKRVKLAYNTTFTNHLNFSEFLEETNITKLNK